MREAIRQLELAGLVVMIPRRGAYVADISLKDVADVFEIRAHWRLWRRRSRPTAATDEEIQQLQSLLVEIERSVEAVRRGPFGRARHPFPRSALQI